MQLKSSYVFVHHDCAVTNGKGAIEKRRFRTLL